MRSGKIIRVKLSGDAMEALADLALHTSTREEVLAGDMLSGMLEPIYLRLMVKGQTETTIASPESTADYTDPLGPQR